MMRVLAIETTCDETSASVVEGNNDGVMVISNVVASSAEIHQRYGGVVPEVAAREQVKSIIPVVSEALRGVSPESIEAIAVSYGPGLMGSLLVGVETAKVLAVAWNKKLIKVNHMEAHVAANWILSDKISHAPSLPAVGLVISGGHTDLILMKSLEQWDWIGGTRDDAVGEAFDKAARILGLSYPGGPSVQKALEKVPDGYSEGFSLPRPMIFESGMEMSFSGLKAALSKLAGQVDLSEANVNLLALEFNKSVVDVLVKKALTAMELYKTDTLVLAGGVAANKMLRNRLENEFSKSKLFIPEFKYCGDNAAMVGAAAIIKGKVCDPASLLPDPSLLTA